MEMYNDRNVREKKLCAYFLKLKIFIICWIIK